MTETELKAAILEIVKPYLPSERKYQPGLSGSSALDGTTEAQRLTTEIVNFLTTPPIERIRPSIRIDWHSIDPSAGVSESHK